jgi:hypothetical protein
MLTIAGLGPAIWQYAFDFDNPLIAIYCIFVVIWGAFFVKFWCRTSNDFAYEWNMLKYEVAEGELDSFSQKARLKEPATVTIYTH